MIFCLFNFSFLSQEKRFDTGNYQDNYIFPAIVGAAFAFGWTPCIGPILGSIITLSATETNIYKGITLLSFYSLGLAVPFILSGYYITVFLNKKKGFSKYFGLVTKTGGLILLFTGILINNHNSNQIYLVFLQTIYTHFYFYQQ